MPIASSKAIAPSPRLALAVSAFDRSDRLAFLASFSPTKAVIVVAKLGSSPNAAAISLRVSRASGELSISVAITDLTNAVLAVFVLLSVSACVGTVGLPVKAGLSIGAFAFQKAFFRIGCKAVIFILINICRVMGMSNRGSGIT